jgi:hypothetical protein
MSMTTTDSVLATLDAVDEQSPRTGIGYVAGGAMLLAAATLWLAAYGQLRLLSPPIQKLTTNPSVGIAKPRDVASFWAFPWRGTGSGAARLAAAAAVVSVVVCMSVRTWWAWGATLVVAPLLVNWYISLCLLLPALLIVDKMRL